MQDCNSHYCSTGVVVVVVGGGGIGWGKNRGTALCNALSAQGGLRTRSSNAGERTTCRNVGGATLLQLHQMQKEKQEECRSPSQDASSPVRDLFH